MVVAVVVLALTAVAYWQLRSGVAPGADRVSPPRSEAPTAGAPAAAAAVPPVTTAPDEGPLLVAIDVSAPCWMQINADKAAEPIVSRVLNSGEHHEFRADHELVMHVGNAGVVSWTINGNAAKPLGRIGERVRVSLTHANLKDYLQ